MDTEGRKAMPEHEEMVFNHPVIEGIAPERLVEMIREQLVGTECRGLPGSRIVSVALNADRTGAQVTVQFPLGALAWPRQRREKGEEEDLLPNCPCVTGGLFPVTGDPRIRIRQARFLLLALELEEYLKDARLGYRGKKGDNGE